MRRLGLAGDDGKDRRMQIIGVEVPGGPPALSFALGHGEDPYQVVWEQGYKVTRPLSATGTVEDLTVTLQVAEHHRPMLFMRVV